MSNSFSIAKQIRFFCVINTVKVDEKKFFKGNFQSGVKKKLITENLIPFFSL